MARTARERERERERERDSPQAAAAARAKSYAGGKGKQAARARLRRDFDDKQGPTMAMERALDAIGGWPRKAHERERALAAAASSHAYLHSQSHTHSGALERPAGTTGSSQSRSQANELANSPTNFFQRTSIVGRRPSGERSLAGATLRPPPPPASNVKFCPMSREASERASAHLAPPTERKQAISCRALRRLIQPSTWR